MRALVTAPPTLYEKVRTQTDAAGLYERRSVRVKRRKERKAARRKAARQQDQSGKRARKRLGELTWRSSDWTSSFGKSGCTSWWGGGRSTSCRPRRATSASGSASALITWRAR